MHQDVAFVRLSLCGVEVMQKVAQRAADIDVGDLQQGAFV